MDIRFQNKALFVLWLLPVVLVLLFIAYGLWRSRTRKKIGDARLVKVLLAGWSVRRYNLKYGLILAALVAGVLAALNPGRTGGKDQQQRSGIDLAIALDVSKSMLAGDLAPSRLERAKQFVIKLMDELPDDRIALILFAGKAYMQMPLTTDHGAAKLFVSAAGPDAVPQQGTVLSDAMEISHRAFSAADKRFKTIILITDGEDHDDAAEKTARELAEQGVMINTVGVGSAEGSVIIDPLTGQNKTDATGNIVVSKLNEPVLRSVAAATNGIYINLQGSDAAIAGIRSQLSQIGKKAYSDVSLLNFRTFFMWFAAAMFLLLVAEQFIPETKKIMA